MKKKTAKKKNLTRFERVVRCIEIYERGYGYREFSLDHCADYIMWCRQFKTQDAEVIENLLDRLIALYENPNLDYSSCEQANNWHC